MNSLWLEHKNEKQNFSTLDKNISCDVCIIGAGIFGITCAYYLSKKGFNVVVLDKDNISRKTTGHTTAKITSQHGLFYNYLVNSYDKSFAKDYLEANEKAILNIKKIIDDENINCDFEFQNSYVYTESKQEIDMLKDEVNILNDIGFNANFVTQTSLPFKIEGAVQFKKQAQFHPLKYIYGLCNCIKNIGGQIYIDTLVTDVKKDGNNYICYTKNNIVKSKYVIMASHYPFLNIPGFYFSKMYQSTSYVIGVDIKQKPFSGMYITAKQPTYSFRNAKVQGKEILLVGGMDHKTGYSTDYANTYGKLEEKVRQLYPNADILYRWNTRDCITLDKIPYIGYYSNIMENMYVGTGFNKWGMTSSNVAANIVTDLILGKENKYAYVFDSLRVKPIKNINEMKNMLTQSVNSIVIDKLKNNTINFSNIDLNCGGIIDVNGKKVGIYKDTSGNVYAVNPVCTHLGCLLSWNNIDKTWDCPCHGSRFDFMGKNLYDPAFENLEIYNLD